MANKFAAVPERRVSVRVGSADAHTAGRNAAAFLHPVIRVFEKGR